MHWEDLKARLLAVGRARLTGEPAEQFIAYSAAGPGAEEAVLFFLPWGTGESNLRSVP